MSILEVERDMSRATSVNQLLSSSYFTKPRHISIPDWMVEMNDFSRRRYAQERESARQCEAPLRFNTSLSHCPIVRPKVDPFCYIPVYGQVFHGFLLWWEIKLKEQRPGRDLINLIITELTRQ